VKSGAALTTSVAEAVCTRAPLEPVIVNGYVPGGVLELVVTDVLEVDAAGFGAKLALAPVGRPLTLRVT